MHSFRLYHDLRLFHGNNCTHVTYAGHVLLELVSVPTLGAQYQDWMRRCMPTFYVEIAADNCVVTITPRYPMDGIKVGGWVGGWAGVRPTPPPRRCRLRRIPHSNPRLPLVPPTCRPNPSACPDCLSLLCLGGLP